MTAPVDNAFVTRETFRLLCGDQVGRAGVSRSVYACRLLPDCVVKIEEESERFQNVIEWETWRRVKETEYARHFAPCRLISPCGIALIMQRTVPAADFPRRMPAFLTDFKRENYGLIDGRLVCHDYGMNLLFENGMTKRTRYADWYE